MVLLILVAFMVQEQFLKWTRMVLILRFFTILTHQELMGPVQGTA